MDRRGFLGRVSAALAAPAIVNDPWDSYYDNPEVEEDTPPEQPRTPLLINGLYQMSSSYDGRNVRVSAIIGNSMRFGRIRAIEDRPYTLEVCRVGGLKPVLIVTLNTQTCYSLSAHPSIVPVGNLYFRVNGTRIPMNPPISMEA